MNTFHLSLAVPDLRPTVEFYRLLGVELKEDHDGWVSLDFFGHQLVLHQATPTLPALAIDHFGCFLRKQRWQELADILDWHNIPFTLPPQRHNAGLATETGKFVIQDPANNRIELKYRSQDEPT